MILILVDLDNLAGAVLDAKLASPWCLPTGKVSGGPLSWIPDSGQAPECPDADPSVSPAVVVVVSANTATARGYFGRKKPPLTRAYLRRLCAAMASCVAPGRSPVTPEFALTLKVSDAVDVLLVRLIQDAGVEWAAQSTGLDDDTWAALRRLPLLVPASEVSEVGSWSVLGEEGRDESR